MSTEKSRGKKRKRGHLLRMLEKVGIIGPEEVEEIKREREENPLEETRQILMNRGVSQEEIDFAEQTSSEDIETPPNGTMEDETTGKRLVYKRQEMEDQMGETITTGIKLADLAAEIAKKNAG